MADGCLRPPGALAGLVIFVIETSPRRALPRQRQLEPIPTFCRMTVATTSSKAATSTHLAT